MDERTLAQLFRYDNDPVSLDAPIGEDGATTLADLVPSSASASPVDLVAQAMLGSHVELILGLLPKLNDGSSRCAMASIGASREHRLWWARSLTSPRQGATHRARRSNQAPPDAGGHRRQRTSRQLNGELDGATMRRRACSRQA